MLVIPAVDIKDGLVVRLLKGDISKSTVYSDDPVSVASMYQAQGAKRLHVVDLDAAFTGELKNFGNVQRIAESLKIPIELGGGIRTKEAALKVLSSRIQYAILGTAVVKDEAFFAELLKKYGDRIIVSVDAKGGFVATRGWVETEKIDAFDFIRKLDEAGVKEIIYTDVEKDGTLQGPNLEHIRKILGFVKNISLIASGGVSSLADLRNLKETGAYGAIVGRALYEKKFTLYEAINNAG